MNYGMPNNPLFLLNQNNPIEEELFQIRKALTLMEERLRKLEEKETKKENPQFLNSEINNKNGLYMI